VFFSLPNNVRKLLLIACGVGSTLDVNHLKWFFWAQKETKEAVQISFDIKSKVMSLCLQ